MIGIVFSGILLGIVFVFVVLLIIVEVFGWEWVFYLFGVMGFIWWIFWDCFVVYLFEFYYCIVLFECEWIINLGVVVGEMEVILWCELLISMLVWVIIVSYFCINWVSYVLLLFLFKYFVEGLGVDFVVVGLFVMFFVLISFLVLNFVGIVVD